jgi:hypothetical protein
MICIDYGKKMTTIKKIFAIIFIIVIGACSKPEAISQTEAERLATIKLEEYVKIEKLSLSQFKKPEVRYIEKDASGKDFKVWEIYYVSKNKPFRHVSINVGIYGGVELHQMIDKE